MLSQKLCQAVSQAIDREGGGGGCLFLWDVCRKTGRPVAEVLLKTQPYVCVPPVENTTCTGVEDYEEVPETVPLDFLENNVTRVAYKLQAL